MTSAQQRLARWVQLAGRETVRVNPGRSRRARKRSPEAAL
jgi:hypothetical protein